MQEPYLVKQEKAPGWIQITFNRPKALNALSQELLVALGQELDELNNQANLRVVTLNGAGNKAFVAGADIASMATMSPGDAAEFSALGHRIFKQIEALPVPVIAIVNGFALGGGCELALACDMIYATPQSKFGQPEVKLGLIPGFGGCVRLAKKIGPGKAKEWIYTGAMYSAQSALEQGLIEGIFSEETIDEEILKITTKISQAGKRALASAKQMLGLAQNQHHNESLKKEESAFSELFSHQEARHGMQAFLEKRKPNFEKAE